jgi:hypothetical protein
MISFIFSLVSFYIKIVLLPLTPSFLFSSAGFLIQRMGLYKNKKNITPNKSCGHCNIKFK